MLESAKGFVKKIPLNGSESVPNEIKTHDLDNVKIIPEENKAHLGDMTRCRIVPEDHHQDMDAELDYIGMPLDSGENIKIVPK